MGTEAKAQRRKAPHVSLKIKVAAAVGAHDWKTVYETYMKYGAYLELTGDDTPVKDHIIICHDFSDLHKKN